LFLKKCGGKCSRCSCVNEVNIRLVPRGDAVKPFALILGPEVRRETYGRRSLSQEMMFFGAMVLEETRGPTRKNVVETTQVDRKLMLIVTRIETLTSQSSSHRRRRHRHAGRRRCGAACSACP